MPFSDPPPPPKSTGFQWIKCGALPGYLFASVSSCIQRSLQNNSNSNNNKNNKTSQKKVLLCFLCCVLNYLCSPLELFQRRFGEFYHCKYNAKSKIRGFKTDR